MKWTETCDRRASVRVYRFRHERLGGTAFVVAASEEDAVASVPFGYRMTFESGPLDFVLVTDLAEVTSDLEVGRAAVHLEDQAEDLRPNAQYCYGSVCVANPTPVRRICGEGDQFSHGNSVSGCCGYSNH